MESFIAEYLVNHPSFLEKVKALESKRRLNLLGKLANERNEINFHSWRSEVGFGLFFDGICQDMKFEQVIDGKRPDWTVWMNGQKIIAEVLRLNTPEEELLQNLAYEKETDRLIKENPKTYIGFSRGAKVLNSEFFYGHQSKLEKKEERYRDIVARHQVPFIICVESTIDTYVSQLDVFDFLVQYNNKGFFYQNPDFSHTVTGVLLKTYFGEFFYFPSEFASVKLNDINIKEFAKLHYRHLD